ncbi:transposase [Holdemanella biformis]|uniref:IS66 family insertion sequence element accessory protein TnpA n=1 Tax=Holdemanella biformis TaxID=1735 RepID=UPI0024930C9F|nr:transposase [Holdemanella biformis]
MNVQSINNDIKTKQWMKTIKECRESGLPVKTWCKQNNVCEQTYYKWLKKLRTMAVKSGAVSVPTFVPVDQSNLKKENIVITKGDVRIKFSCHTDIKTITNIIGALLC